VTGLVANSLVARDADGLKGAPRGVVYGISFTLTGGVACFMGAPEDGTVALAEAIIGRRRPDRGSLSIAGRDPFTDPAVRATIGYVGLQAAIPAAASVKASIEIAVSGWSSPPLASDVLAKAGLSALALRRVEDTSPAERRAVEWALLLALPSPSTVVVFEPFSDLASVSASVVERELARIAKQAPVVVFTSSARDARRFDRVAILHRGAVARDSQSPHAALGNGQATALTVGVTSGARELARALLENAIVHSLTFDRDPAASAETESSLLRISGDDREALALGLADAVIASGASLVSVTESAPALAEVRAQTEFEQRSRMLEIDRSRLQEARAAAERAQLTPQWPGPGGPGAGSPYPTPFGAVGSLAAPALPAPNFMPEPAPAVAPQARPLAEVHAADPPPAQQDPNKNGASS